MKFLILYLLFISCNEEKPFNKEVWLSSSNCKPIKQSSFRYSMLKDLNDKILPGKNRLEIEELLGPSLEHKVLKGVKRDLIYCVGRSYGLSVNMMILHLKDNYYSHMEIISVD